MPAPFTLEDSGGNNYVDAVTRKINEQGRVFYEVKGRNTTAQQRLVRFYDKNIVKSYVVQDGAELEISAPGRVHKQMQDHLTELLNHFELPSTLNFVSPYTIHDSNGNNYVDSVTRAIDENGAVYYEVRGRNKNNEERIIHLYDNKVVKSYVVTDGIKKPSDKMGQVHQQMHEKMNEILKYFSINRPLNFINPSLKPEVLIPKKPPAIIPSATNEELPTREFFIAAAQRAIELGDRVFSKQTGVHFTRGALLGAGSDFYDEGNSTRLNLFHELVDGSKDGYYPFAATTAYGLSLLTYIASHYDKLDKAELKRLYTIYKAVAGDIPTLGLEPSSPEYRLALAQGLKAEVNEITALRERLSYGHSVDAPLAQYRSELVAGNPSGRPVIDKQTSFTATSTVDSSLTRSIPGFFPISPTSGTTDQIVLQAGGCRTHSAIVSIWKEGVDKEGDPVIPGDEKTIERYRVYRTVCNAGFGTTYNVRTNPPALYHEIFSPKADGQTYSVCTQEVLLPIGLPYSDEAMQRQIGKLIDAERSLLLFHDLPGTKGPNNEVGTLDLVKQAQWRELNQSIRLGPVETTHSVLSPPQVTGNCTVRSIEEYLRWELIRKGVSQHDAEAILDKHWGFATTNDSASITTQLSQLSAQLKSGKKGEEPTLLSEMNIVKAKSFFENPITPAFPKYSPDKATPSETASLVQKIRSGKKSCPKPTMISIDDLLAQVSLTPQDKAQTGMGLYLLQGCDARTVPAFACMQGAVRQVASQFNNGESKGRYETQPDNFKTDPTQGPAEQRTAGGAALARYAHNKNSDCFAPILADPGLKTEFNTLFDYQYGYLTPKEGQEKKGLDFLKKHINQIVLNVERVPIDGVAGQTAIQVLNSGLALGGYDLYHRTPEATGYLKEMTELVLSAQYKAVSAIAILEAQKNPEKRIPVSFTMVGGGAFGNDKVAIAKSVSQAIKLIKESGVNNIDICLSIYQASEIAAYKKIAAQGAEFSELKELLNQKPITQAQLHSIQSLHVLPNSLMPIETELEVPSLVAAEEELAPTAEVKKYANKEIVKAMQAAIAALSTKSHLSTDGRQQKKDVLANLLLAYQESSTSENANKALLKFLITASKQRESNWCSLFTSKFGETASAKVFFEHVHTEELKSMVLKATKIAPAGTQIDFKEFAKSLRDKYEHSEQDDERSHRL